MNIYRVINTIDIDSLKIESVIDSCETIPQLLTCLEWISSVYNKWIFFCKQLQIDDRIYCRNYINDRYDDLITKINNDNLRCG